MISMTPAEQLIAVQKRLLAYTRGIDRLDAALICSAFHPGAVLEGYGSEPSTIEKFVEHAIPGLRAGFSATQHRLANISVEDCHDHLFVESYVLALHVIPRDDDLDQLCTFAGRYIDRFEYSEKDWRIVKRILVYDYSSIETLGEKMRGQWNFGARDRSDPVFAAYQKYLPEE